MDFVNNTGEQQDLWKAQKIDTRIDNWDAVSKVKKIDSNGNITVVYTFVREKFFPFFKTGKRKVIYCLNQYFVKNKYIFLIISKISSILF
jgi:hypothetical protein